MDHEQKSEKSGKSGSKSQKYSDLHKFSDSQFQTHVPINQIFAHFFSIRTLYKEICISVMDFMILCKTQYVVPGNVDSSILKIGFRLTFTFNTLISRGKLASSRKLTRSNTTSIRSSNLKSISLLNITSLK